MKRFWYIFALIALIAIPNLVYAETADFLEKFILAQDRNAVLKQLIPGTRDYYYYHALHAQNLGQLDEVEKIIKTWQERYSYDPRRTEIEHRQALLRYASTPQTTLSYLIRILNLQFNHSRQVRGEKPTLPSRLDPKLIDHSQLAAKALSASSYSLYNFTDHALYWLSQQSLAPSLRRNLLQRMKHPAIPNLVALVAADLDYSYSRGFGSINIHRLMLRQQLDQLLQLKPDLLKDNNFVQIYLSKLRPNPDMDIERDPVQYRIHLDLLWSFVRKLEPSHNSLKLHILYHRLKHNLEQGNYDQQLFIEYIQIPRHAPYVNNKYLQDQSHRSHIAYRSSGNNAHTGLPEVENDEPLIRQYLTHFFRTEESYKSYSVFLQEEYLKQLFAETKLLYGIGKSEQWFDLIPASKLKELRERVELEFLPTNKKQFGADETVNLFLKLKNISNLIVKVYTINALNYYQKHNREVDAAINLDGLVANTEKTYRYKHDAMRRFTETFTFEMLDKPGVYIVDFIGNGKNSRALIHKGKLHYIERLSIAGHIFTVLDQSGKPALDPYIWYANRRYLPDKDGVITIPYTRQPQRQSLLLGSGDFVSLDSFAHQAEKYDFQVRFFLDREALLARRQATALIRPSLHINGVPAALALLKDVALEVTAIDRFGVKSTTNISKFALHENRESTYSFRVPENLSDISFKLTAKIENISQAKTDNLAANQNFSANQIDRSAQLLSFHLKVADDNYTLSMRDRSGRAIANRVVSLRLHHRHFQQPVTANLQTDERGRIELGKLKDISKIYASSEGGIYREWNMLQYDNHLPTVLHGAAGQTLYVPYSGKAQTPLREELALLEKLSGMYVADRFASLKIENNLIAISDLAVGDYELLIHPSQQVNIRITAGSKQGDFLIGKYRALEIQETKPLQIAKVELSDKQLEIKLVNATPEEARVHVITSRYLPSFNPFTLSSPLSSVLALRNWAFALSHYLEGRGIGDEYRYILDRKYATKYPGNMLQRPSLLLNPWAIHKTETTTQTALGGGAFGTTGRGGGFARPSPLSIRTAKEMILGRGLMPNLDFLADSSVIIYNLKPDANGMVSIPREKLGSHSLIQILAIDSTNSAYRYLSVSPVPLKTRDLRLLRNLPPTQHYTQQVRIDHIAKDQTFKLTDITTSQSEFYDSLEKVRTLYHTLNPNSTLQTFSFIIRWPQLSDDEKRAKYSKYACHELNFFLYKKDPSFFKSVILPYLKHKKEKTFLDHWLLDNDAELQTYLSPWKYAKLNTVERVLLGQRVTKIQKSIFSQISDLLELRPPDPSRAQHLFDTALQLSALHSRGPVSALRDSLDKLEEQTTRMPPSESESLRGPSAASPPAPPAASARDEAPARAKRSYRRSRPGMLRMDDLRRREAVRQFYRAPDKTREWVENQYYQLPLEQQNANLVQANAFWKDYANHTGEQPFISTNLATATRNFTEMMFALAVLDLPFTSPEHESAIEQSTFTLKAKTGLIAFYKAIQKADAPKAQTPILVSQNFFAQAQQYQYIRGQRVERYVTDEFLTNTVYGSQIVVTNPTSTSQKLDLLLQIPQGAMPVQNGRYTHNVTVQLAPYQTHRLQYYFYFPTVGTFEHFPVHVAQDGKLVAFALPSAFKVVEQPTIIDRSSWEYISQQAPLPQVLEFLRQNNFQRVSLSQLAWRMQDKEVFAAIIAVLRERLAYDQTLWSYALKHNDALAIRDYLQHRPDFTQRIGQYLRSELLNLDPYASGLYQHREYKPLINARAHKLGATRRILNDRFRNQYQALLNLLTYRHPLTPDDKLALVYYLLLQDRITAALDLYKGIDVSALNTRIQYDYLTTYLAFYQSQLDIARKFATQYQNYPVLRWQKLFAEALRQLDEIQTQTASKPTDPKDRAQAQTQLASTEVSFNFQIKDRKISVSHRNAQKFTVNYYLMDIELLFSRSPFVQKHSDQFAYIQPNLSQEIAAAQANGITEFALPAQFHNSNVMIEIRSAGIQQAHAYFANSLDVQIAENYGQLQVTTLATPHKPLSSVYVKVYARLKNNTVQFYKDGYTDLRGRFDYSSLSTDMLNQVQRFAILVLSDAHGAVVREVAPPKQ